MLACSAPSTRNFVAGTMFIYVRRANTEFDAMTKWAASKTKSAAKTKTS
jgi:hypothetical protein